LENNDLDSDGTDVLTVLRGGEDGEDITMTGEESTDGTYGSAGDGDGDGGGEGGETAVLTAAYSPCG